jgi:hypothetical protein
MVLYELFRKVLLSDGDQHHLPRHDALNRSPRSAIHFGGARDLFRRRGLDIQRLEADFEDFVGNFVELTVRSR